MRICGGRRLGPLAKMMSWSCCSSCISDWIVESSDPPPVLGDDKPWKMDFGDDVKLNITLSSRLLGELAVLISYKDLSLKAMCRRLVVQTCFLRDVMDLKDGHEI